MGLSEERFIKTSEKYGSGIAIDEYQGEFSVCAVTTGKDGKLYLRWTFPQVGRDKPAEKAIPHKINLGNKAQATHRLERLLLMVEQS